jgi:hypothetical protein
VSIPPHQLSYPLTANAHETIGLRVEDAKESAVRQGMRPGDVLVKVCGLVSFDKSCKHIVYIYIYIYIYTMLMLMCLSMCVGDIFLKFGPWVHQINDVLISSVNSPGDALNLIKTSPIPLTVVILREGPAPSSSFPPEQQQQQSQQMQGLSRDLHAIKKNDV